ncbi:recombination initiation defects 3 [Tanacetum coccineum]|uniref:Recombination initiation defects 3 n=1 Tax=Tanacetum coccineum TaxID=301880 RepID=A0ABQ5ARI4_9ASTR
MAISRSSNGVLRKWGSGVSEQRCQMSEEVERRLGTIESSLSRFGLMLESLQTDIMQVNRGTKELAIDMESIRQKLIAHDNSLQTIIKGQEDVKSTLIGELKSISDKLNQDTCHQNLKEISILLSTLQEKIRVFVLNLRNDLSKSFTNEMQALGCKLKALGQKNPIPTVLPPRAVNYGAKPVSVGITPQNSALPPKVQPGTRIPKVEMGGWNLVKYEHTAITDRDDINGHKHTRVPRTEPKRELGVIIDCDEDVGRGFAFFDEENETGRYLALKAKEETELILRKARRRKRKYSNAIVTIN